MTYKIAIHQEALETLDSIPTKTRARLLAVFETTLACGLTAISPRELSWRCKNEFTLNIHHNYFDTKLINGAIAKGFFYEDTKDTYYIGQIHLMKDATCMISGNRDYALKHRDTIPDREIERYIQLDREWIDKQIKNPFIAKHYRQPENLNYAVSTVLDHFEHSFYQSVDDIFLIKKKELKALPALALSNDLAKLNAEYLRFDTGTHHQMSPQNLIRVINAHGKKSNTFLMVNFIDELDPLSLAQTNYFNLLSSRLHAQYPTLNIQIIDVIMRDIQGAQPYNSTFLHYHEHNRLGRNNRPNHAVPFTMISGGVAADYNLKLPDGYYNDQRTTNELSYYDRVLKNKTGLSKAERMEVVTDIWRGSDNAKAFVAGLDENGYTLRRRW